ncbi:MAG TPA: hypothetical protein VFI90_17125 [Rubrobacter sp.]|nr:hypothetical protein [Rubrobacter sp.]
MDDQQGKNIETPNPGKPWGFYLVLAAIFVVAIVYSVSIVALGLTSKLTPETVFGAMAACFTVIGTLVGTYFGIKAGLDGQDKVKQTLASAGESFRQRPQGGIERNTDGKVGGRPLKDEHSTIPELQDRGPGEHGKQQGWDGGGV